MLLFLILNDRCLMYSFIIIFVQVHFHFIFFYFQEVVIINTDSVRSNQTPSTGSAEGTVKETLGNYADSEPNFTMVPQKTLIELETIIKQFLKKFIFHANRDNRDLSTCILVGDTG